MFKTLQYYWNAARGYRFRPWESPYIRWRFETFLGKEAANLTASKFFHLAWKYREHMERFVDWATERHRFQRRRHARQSTAVLNKLEGHAPDSLTGALRFR